MIEPKEVVIDQKTFILSKVPAFPAREIFCQYTSSGLPGVGNYKLNEEMSLKLLSFVQVRTSGDTSITLTTKELINNHVPSWETLLKLEFSMLEYNCSFFRDGRISNFFADVAQKLPQWISKTLMDSLDRLSQMEKPLS